MDYQQSWRPFQSAVRWARCHVQSKQAEPSLDSIIKLCHSTSRHKKIKIITTLMELIWEAGMIILWWLQKTQRSLQQNQRATKKYQIVGTCQLIDVRLPSLKENTMAKISQLSFVSTYLTFTLSGTFLLWDEMWTTSFVQMYKYKFHIIRVVRSVVCFPNKQC